MRLAKLGTLGTACRKKVQNNKAYLFIFKTSSVFFTFVALAALIRFSPTHKPNHPLLDPAVNYNLGVYALHELSSWQLCNLNPTLDPRCASVLARTAHLPHLTYASRPPRSTDRIFSLSDRGAPLPAKLARHAGLARAAIAEFEAAFPGAPDLHLHLHLSPLTTSSLSSSSSSSSSPPRRPGPCERLRRANETVAALLPWEDLFWEWHRRLKGVFPPARTLSAPVPGSACTSSSTSTSTSTSTFTTCNPSSTSSSTSTSPSNNGEEAIYDREAADPNDRIAPARLVPRGHGVDVGGEEVEEEEEVDEVVEETWLLTRLLVAQTYVRAGRGALAKEGEGFGALVRECGGHGMEAVAEADVEVDVEVEVEVELRAAEDVRRAIGEEMGGTVPGFLAKCLVLSVGVVRLAGLVGRWRDWGSRKGVRAGGG